MVKSGAASYGCELTDAKEQQEEKAIGEEEEIPTKVKTVLNMDGALVHSKIKIDVLAFLINDDFNFLGKSSGNPG